MEASETPLRNVLAGRMAVQQEVTKLRAAVDRLNAEISRQGVYDVLEKALAALQRSAGMYHATQHNVHLYHFDQDPKCPDQHCRESRRVIDELREAL